MEVPTAALVREYGPQGVEVDRSEFRFARVRARPDLTIEAGFGGVFRMFGALIDTHWLGRRGMPPTSPLVDLHYRFDQERFRGTGPASEAIASRLGNARTRDLAKRAELKSIRVQDSPEGRLVDITPLPGTITAMYLPPLPPYTVPIKPPEADAQLALLLHLADL
ncbi:MAG: hypothetical protein ACRDVK_12455 [Acidimicrobiia bacterium]